MIKICNIKGMPRTIHTMILKRMLTGLMRLIVQKEINNPKGRAMTSVSKNSKQVNLKPLNKYNVTSKKLIGKKEIVCDEKRHRRFYDKTIIAFGKYSR